MNRYETVIRIISYGDDPYDAGEKAGELLDPTRMREEFLISCEPTRQIISEEENSYKFKKRDNIRIEDLIAA